MRPCDRAFENVKGVFSQKSGYIGYIGYIVDLAGFFGRCYRLHIGYCSR